jgi:hypothetical protein
MTSPTDNGPHSGSPSPIADQGDDGDAANDDQGQNWLTIRRRCELCKQRKVRSSNAAASVELACSNSRLISNPCVSRSWYSHGPPVERFSMAEVGFQAVLAEDGNPVLHLSSHLTGITFCPITIFFSSFRQFETSASLYGI